MSGHPEQAVEALEDIAACRLGNKIRISDKILRSYKIQNIVFVDD